MKKLFVTATIVVAVSVLMVVASSCKEKHCHCTTSVDGIFESESHSILKGTEKCKSSTWEEAGHIYKVKCVIPN